MDLNPAQFVMPSQAASTEGTPEKKRIPYTPGSRIQLVRSGVAAQNQDFLRLKSQLSHQQDTVDTFEAGRKKGKSQKTASGGGGLPADVLDSGENSGDSIHDGHGVRVYPKVTEGRFEPAAGSGRWRGINEPILALDRSGAKLVFKQNRLGIFGRVLHPNEQARRDAREVVASRILADEFQLPTITYHEAYYLDTDGNRREGLACSYIPGLSTLLDFPPGKVKNPGQAVRLCIARCWLGDWDQLKNDSNFWVDGEGSLSGGDYGFAFCRGVDAWGTAAGNLTILKTLFRESFMEPVLTRILHLSDREIRDMVHRGAKHLHYWNDTWEEEFTAVLVHNRERLRTATPFESWAAGSGDREDTTCFYPPVLFTPEFTLGADLGHPEVITDPLKAVIGAILIPVVFRVIVDLEERAVVWKNRERYYQDWLWREQQKKEKQSIKKIIDKIPRPWAT